MTSLRPKEADFKIKSILVREFPLIISDDSSLSSPSLAEKFDSDSSSAVSYTHLTLPTILLV